MSQSTNIALVGFQTKNQTKKKESKNPTKSLTVWKKDWKKPNSLEWPSRAAPGEVCQRMVIGMSLRVGRWDRLVAQGPRAGARAQPRGHVQQAVKEGRLLHHAHRWRTTRVTHTLRPQNNISRAAGTWLRFVPVAWMKALFKLVSLKFFLWLRIIQQSKVRGFKPNLGQKSSYESGQSFWNDPMTPLFGIGRSLHSFT